MKNKALEKIKCFLLDMDGTVHLSGVAIEGAPEAVERMRKQGRVFFLTNNTSIGRADYVKKLCAMGIQTADEDIYTAGNATVDYLNEYHKNKTVYLMGTQKLYSEFRNGGIVLTDKAPDLVVVGFDTELTYEKLEKACRFIREGVPYILTHPDINCPTRDGYIPDAGSFNALIELSTAKKPLITCGKPNKPIGDGIMRLTDCKSDDIAMVGDRLSTDIVFALNNGFVPVLVLSGEATMQDLKKSNLPVKTVLRSIADWDM